jgi:hypothetical protein
VGLGWASSSPSFSSSFPIVVVVDVVVGDGDGTFRLWRILDEKLL